jgi:hypothetical protein
VSAYREQPDRAVRPKRWSRRAHLIARFAAIAPCVSTAIAITDLPISAAFRWALAVPLIFAAFGFALATMSLCIDEPTGGRSARADYWRAPLNGDEP